MRFGIIYAYEVSRSVWRTMTFRMFISSVQDEFAEERRRLKQWLTTDLFVSRFVDSVFLFEDVPSTAVPSS